MQCGERYRKESAITAGRECIHSGHFMVSHFEADEQDEDDVAVPIPEPLSNPVVVLGGSPLQSDSNSGDAEKSPQPLSIETSLTKLFQCMSLAYRQKLTSPKWNRFKGIRLRWKDKIRLNNVIWRCWHMQFIMKQNTLVCQFASPLDVDTHNKPEAVVLEGKYWKRKLAAVTAEYKKWRMFYRNRSLGYLARDASDVLSELDLVDWPMHMLVDDDYMQLMSDTLFSTISNQPYAFPDSREIARGAGLADFIQPSLGPLQPNLDDFMDTLEPLQELLGHRLPPVPEETVIDVYRPSQGPIIAGSETPANYNLIINQSDMDSSGLQDNFEPSYAVALDPQIEQNYMHGFETPIIPTAMSRPGKSRPRSVGSHSSGRNRDSGKYPQMPYGYSASNLCHSNAMPPQNNVRYMNSALSMNMSNLSSNHNDPPIAATNLMNIQPNIMSIQNNLNSLSNMQPTNLTPLQNIQPKIAPNLSNLQTILLKNHSNIPNNMNIQSSLSNLSNTIQPNLSKMQSSVQNASVQGNLSNIQPNLHQMKTSPPPKLSPQAPFRTPSPQQQQNFKIHSRGYNSSEQGNGSTLKKTSKEMYRSNSLPLNGTLQIQEDLFLMPRANHRAQRTNFKPPQLMSALSDPNLNQNSVLLTHLLSNNQSTNSMLNVTQCNTQPAPLLTTRSAHNLLSTNTSAMLNSPHCSVSNSQPSTQVLQPPSPIQEPTPSFSEAPLSPSRASRLPPRENRRAGHIHAEQKRRYNIKNGFDTLHSLIPQLHQNPSAKLSKAAMLQKGAEYIKQLQVERKILEEEMKNLRLQVDGLNTSISNCQGMLPATGAPISRQRTGRVPELFQEYVRIRTLDNWKFWIFSLLVEPLLLTFNASVSTASLQELYRTTLQWVDQHCSLVDLRPAILNSLRQLCTSTDILAHPERLPQEAKDAVTRSNKPR